MYKIIVLISIILTSTAVYAQLPDREELVVEYVMQKGGTNGMSCKEYLNEYIAFNSLSELEQQQILDAYVDVQIGILNENRSRLTTRIENADIKLNELNAFKNENP